VAQNPAVPADLLRVLAADKARSVRWTVAQSAVAPERLLRELAEDKEQDVRRAVAANAKTPVDTLRKLARDRQLRSTVLAESPYTPIALLAEFAEDKDPETRSCVAANKRAGPALLAKLARDKVSSVRAAVALNPNASVELLSVLAKESDANIRNCVASNPRTSAELLSQLARGDDPYGAVQAAVARHENTPDDVLQTLADDNRAWVREAAKAALGRRGLPVHPTSETEKSGN
jgi:hypothetical protein